eukprot:TRINITY_DN27580_c0_g1_i4.p2 TRINITY_DN27580_c0_g1~~TRINITY_DN27580_c0_g1_i4.p2  ORF type:complete len:239 (-),score=25.51 TRINITY_DN27580_c0_g1_i4:861-1475(-)
MSGQGSSSQQQTQQRQQRDKRLVNLSKQMTKILRHHPPPGMDSSGWVTVDELFTCMRSKVDMEVVQQVVETDEKGRFDLDMSANPPRIRATQGHSVQLEEPVLEPITSAEQVTIAVHVTSKDGWQAIQESGQILRMNRTHIHFATIAAHVRRNNWAQIFLVLDVDQALKDGIQLYRSTNGVLLAEGPIPISYIQQHNGMPSELQ